MAFYFTATIAGLAIRHQLARKFDEAMETGRWQGVPSFASKEFQTKKRLAETLARTEYIAAALLLVLVGGLVYTGQRLARQVRDDSRAKGALVAQVHEAEDKYRSIVDHAVEGIFQTTVAGHYLTANQSLAAMYGFETPEDLIANVTDVRGIYASPERRNELLKLLKEGDVVEGFQSEIIRRDGSTMWVSANVRAERDAQGELLYLEGTVEDITESWWAQRRQELQYATAVVLAESSTVAEARPRILQTICELLEWDMGSVWEVDAAARELHCLEVWHRPEIDIDEFQLAASGMAIPCGVGLAGKVCETGEPAWSTNLDQFAAMPDVSIAAKRGMRSVFGVPVKAGHEVLHVLKFFSPKAVGLDAELARILAAIGMQLGHLIERKRGEEALRASEVRKAAILESALDCILTFDHEGRITEFNPAAERAFGYRRAEVLGKEMAELIIPEAMRETHRRGLALSASGPASESGRRVEMSAMRADRTEFPIEMGITRVNVADRPMFIAYIRDITHRKRAERTRSELAAVVESSNDAIVGLTLEGTIVSWNKGAERIYGYAPQEVLDQPFHVLVPPDKIDELAQMLGSIQRGRGVANFETVRMRKDGKRINVSITESPIRNEHARVTGLSSIARDITENKRLEEQLLHSQKMEAVGRLAGGVAHDFNNILTAVLGYSDLLLHQIDQQHPMFKNLSGIRQSAELAATLTHQLLAFSRRQSLQLKVFDINEVVTNIQKMLRRLIGEDIHIITVLAPRIGLVRADAGQLQQVLMNLAVNARDAMPKGGVLTFQTSNLTLLTDDLYHTNEVAAGDYVKLTVTDTGTGMTDEVKKHIFEPFFTTKEKGKGTGLGLATCYGIITQCSGHIQVESQAGQGTSFQIFLPRVEASAATTFLDKPEEQLSHGHETVLIVEDEATVRNLTVHILRKLGYHVLEAKDSASARTLIMERNGEFDLMFADVVLPDGSGKELAEWVEQTYPGRKVLFTSGYVEETLFKQYGIDSGSAFLQKPFTPAGLARKVREMIDARPARNGLSPVAPV